MDAKLMLLDIPFLGRKFFRKLIVSHEGGPQSSQTLRKYVQKNYHVEVGNYSYGSCFNKEFNVGGTVTIGRYCSFGPDVRYFGANHPMEYVSMSPYFYQKSWAAAAGAPIKTAEAVSDISRFHLEVGHDCWVGCGSIITCGCRSIGNGAVIGAGSVVTRDVAPYSIVAGDPAKVIRYRFDEPTIQSLENSEWYNLEPNILLNYYDFIDDPEAFVRAIESWRKKEESKNIDENG